MTVIYLTDQDYEVIESGDENEIKVHVNEIRRKLHEAQQECIRLLRMQEYEQAKAQEDDFLYRTGMAKHTTCKCRGSGGCGPI